MYSDKEIEIIGMKVSIEYEKDNGRLPVNVSSENLCYDIRSTGSDRGKVL